MRHALKRALKGNASICAFHGSGNDLTSETHTPRQCHMFTRDRIFSFTSLMAFSTMPADAESYFGGACAMALTPKRSLRRGILTCLVHCLTINFGYSSLFSDSTRTLIAAWSSTPLHCTVMLLHHQKQCGPFCWFLSISEENHRPCSPREDCFVLAVVCERPTALHHQHMLNMLVQCLI